MIIYNIECSYKFSKFQTKEAFGPLYGTELLSGNTCVKLYLQQFTKKGIRCVEEKYLDTGGNFSI